LIGSGEAQERGIIGETPNLAARLQGIAEPNTELSHRAPLTLQLTYLIDPLLRISLKLDGVATHHAQHDIGEMFGAIVVFASEGAL
jgi:hypothetical protein